MPNNAVLVVAGDIDIAKTKKLVDYFGPIPKGADVVRNYPKETPITTEIKAKAFVEHSDSGEYHSLPHPWLYGT